MAGGGYFYKESVAPLGFYWVSAVWSILEVFGGQMTSILEILEVHFGRPGVPLEAFVAQSVLNKST